MDLLYDWDLEKFGEGADFHLYIHTKNYFHKAKIMMNRPINEDDIEECRFRVSSICTLVDKILGDYTSLNNSALETGRQHYTEGETVSTQYADLVINELEYFLLLQYFYNAYWWDNKDAFRQIVNMLNSKAFNEEKSYLEFWRANHPMISCVESCSKYIINEYDNPILGLSFDEFKDYLRLPLTHVEKQIVEIVAVSLANCWNKDSKFGNGNVLLEDFYKSFLIEGCGFHPSLIEKEILKNGLEIPDFEIKRKNKSE